MGGGLKRTQTKRREKFAPLLPDCGSWDMTVVPDLIVGAGTSVSCPWLPCFFRPWDSDFIIPPALLGLQLARVPSLQTFVSQFLIILNLLLQIDG